MVEWRFLLHVSAKHFLLSHRYYDEFSAWGMPDFETNVQGHTFLGRVEEELRDFGVFLLSCDI